eukprot:SAG11_NODE_2543_length_3237_cov_2.170172_3_plen_102_part_00
MNVHRDAVSCFVSPDVEDWDRTNRIQLKATLVWGIWPGFLLGSSAPNGPRCHLLSFSPIGESVSSVHRGAGPSAPDVAEVGDIQGTASRKQTQMYVSLCAG